MQRSARTPSEESADWASFPTVLIMAAPMPSPTMEFAEYGKALGTARTKMPPINDARTSIPWIRKDLKRDQDVAGKAEAKAKVRAKPKAKARARGKEKERKAKAKERASVAKVMLPQHSLNNGRTGNPELPLSRNQTCSRSKKENGVKNTPRPESAKVAT